MQYLNKVLRIFVLSLVSLSLVTLSWATVFPAVTAAAAWGNTWNGPSWYGGWGNYLTFGSFLPAGYTYRMPSNSYPAASNLWTVDKPGFSSNAVSNPNWMTIPSPATTVTTPPASNTSPASNSAGSAVSSDEQQALRLLNADRAAQGLPALRLNSQLTALAESYTQDMVRRNFFSHTNPEGQSPFDRMRQAGISYVYAGENLAINQNVAAAETAFMNSAGHRANILNPHYTDVGIGVTRSSNGSVYVAQEFIGR
ncbi:Hypothetical protein LUCI_1811 [Lucifera butyrica]|uniref:SCP domain-containing protein n=1 Tax=Lucifera butyrica TaxID=1351585 RepID=A0A498R629_9FIRM|nr:CAP domain-containing protein [Lucifera butyrica]VBB06575.1 Hypothetical protein LUCI_1811 [Lucifera butyrica]